MASAEDLRRHLARIDGRGYPAYQEIRGAWELGDLTLFVDRVQRDPFAAPSRLRARLPLARAALPARLFDSRVRAVACRDFLARRAADAIGQRARARSGSGRSGELRVDAGGQEVLERTAVVFGGDWVELRVEAGLPAGGRRVLGRAAESLLCDELPEIARRVLAWQHLPREEAEHFVDCVDNQEQLRVGLAARGLLAFVADGSILPRESGASDRPLPAARAVPFASPESLRIELPLAHAIDGPGGPRRTLSGMGIRRGVTLVVGGGYHGKSTLLRALQRGVYPHVPGDGREYVVSDPGLVKLRAEDGRRVEQVDIAGFISDLPDGRRTRAFSSDDASGSTSQAANLVEALEAGATGLLLDEDSSATNFMVRDARMQALVPGGHEPITPFLERVRELYQRLGLSTLLVMGGCGDYFDAADSVIRLQEFRPVDATADARRVAASLPTGRRREARAPLAPAAARVPLPESFDASVGRRAVRIDARGLDGIRFGREEIDLRGVEQLVDPSQARAVGCAIQLAAVRFADGKRSLAELLDGIDALFDAEGLDALEPGHRPGHHPGNFARPRRFEVAAAINRLRSLRVRQRRP